MNSSMNWQVMSFVLIFNLAVIMLIVGVCLNRINARRRQALFTIGVSTIGGSLVGMVASQYFHYYPSFMLCLGAAGLIADRFILWFEGKSSLQQKQ